MGPGMVNQKNQKKSDAEEPTARLAVLIDADNAQAAVIDGLFAEIARYGEATVRRIYGDFTTQASSSWKQVLQRHAIKPVQQFAYTTGKNATDSALIIDAMDLVYTRRFDGFCLVTSDSDFTGLAVRLREEGLMVLGFGEQKTGGVPQRVPQVHVHRGAPGSRRGGRHKPAAGDSHAGAPYCDTSTTAGAVGDPKGLPDAGAGAVSRRCGLGPPGDVWQLSQQAAARVRLEALRLQEAVRSHQSEDRPIRHGGAAVPRVGPQSHVPADALRAHIRQAPGGGRSTSKRDEASSASACQSPWQVQTQSAQEARVAQPPEPVPAGPPHQRTQLVYVRKQARYQGFSHSRSHLA